MKLISTAMRGGREVRTRHRRWPNGYPSGLYVGRVQGFRTPSIWERIASSMTKANRTFAYLKLKAPKFGRLLDAE